MDKELCYHNFFDADSEEYTDNCVVCGKSVEDCLQEKTKCPRCGKKVLRHARKEGARFHVYRWDDLGRHCSEKDCEENHKCKKAKEDK